MANVDAFNSGFDMGSGKKTPKKKLNKPMPEVGAAGAAGAAKGAAKPSSFKKGGKVRKTGVAKVHKGEIVLTASEAKSCAKSKKRGKKSNRKIISKR